MDQGPGKTLDLLSTASRYNGPVENVSTLTKQPESQRMWHLIEDFFEQSLVMKGFIGLGWLSILIMVTSIIYTLA